MFESVFKRKIEQQKETKEFGHNITARLVFMRHEQPGKTPEGMSADFLTEQGKQNAMGRGKNIKEGPVKLYASPKHRAKETIDLLASNVNDNVEIINKYDTKDKDLIYNVREVEELDVAPNMKDIWLEGTTWAKEQIKNGDTHNELDLTVQYLLNNPERAKELNAPNPEEVASVVAHRVNTEIQMTNRFYDNTDVTLLNGTHGPKLEMFLSQVLKIQDKKTKEIKTGFEHIDTIGGALQPGESLELVVERSDKDTDENDNYNLGLNLRGNKYEIDKDRLKQLSQMYKNNQIEKNAV